MNFQRGRRHEDLEINLVPLIDVLLVIIIFLVVSATFSRINELQINLPTAQANQQQDKPIVINVGIDATGRTEINNAVVPERTVEALTLALRKAAGSGKEPTVVINADAKTTHQSVINVMEAARQSGLTHITFATQSPGS
ncbi:MAG: biopolymer transporter ExbD [Methylophilales bacterium RIFCSPHIGHO2_02_FULL_57_10]|nr:MAG: biopolymer transporter ExbD [Methylophilales bacterium RIFCSPHIGHO2_02_FULL_57_10]